MEEEKAWLEEHFMNFNREYWITERVSQPIEDSRVYVVVPDGVTKVNLEFSQGIMEEIEN